MKRFLIITENDPKNDPKIVQINVGEKLYSKVKLFIPKVDNTI